MAYGGWLETVSRFVSNKKKEMKKKNNLQIYEVLPEVERRYLANYGKHFNRQLCDEAVRMMRRENGEGKLVRVASLSKEQVENLLSTYGITLENNVLYDHVYVANMIHADMRGSSIEDDLHHARAIKDFIDDADQEDGYLFDRWRADMCGKGVVIDWEEMIG